MNKIIEIIILSLIGVVEGIALLISWILGIIYLILNEIVGTRRFMKKFRRLNTIIVKDFKEIIRNFKQLINESK